MVGRRAAPKKEKEISFCHAFHRSIRTLRMEAQDEVEIAEEGEPVDWTTILSDAYGIQEPSEWDKAAFFIRRTKNLLNDSLFEPPIFGIAVDKMQCPILGMEFKNDMCLLLDDSMEPVCVEFVQLCIEQATDLIEKEDDDAAGLSAINKIKNPFTNQPIQRILLVKAALKNA